MTRLALLLARAGLLFALVATLSLNALAGVETGVAWLSGQVQPDGRLANEATSIALPVQAQTEAYLALKQLGTAPVALGDRIAADDAVATELLARRVLALQAAGRPVQPIVDQLLARQGDDGGFPPFASLGSTALDTAWALLACDVGSCPAAKVTIAIEYLRSSQEPDGAFGIYGESSLSITSLAILALQAFHADFPSAPQIAAARTFVLGQGSSGQYNDTYFNALATLALAATGSEQAPLDALKSALLAAQRPDGSWELDPFVTALALRALGATAAQPTTPGFVGTIVEDATGLGLGAAAINATGPRMASATSAATGTFSVPDLLAGTYSLEFTRLGFVGATRSASVGTGVTDLGTIRLALAADAGILQGTVRDGANGQVIAGASISINAGALTAVTDAGGFYRLAGVPAGSASVSISRAGYLSLSTSVAITAGQTLIFGPGLYAQAPPAVARVVGAVVDQNGGAPIAGATVMIGASQATTGVTGAFAVENVAPGAISIVVSKSGYTTSTYTASVVVGTNDVGNLQIRIPQTAAVITGRVTDSGSTVPVAGATVTIAGVGSSQTNIEGRYTISGVAQLQFGIVATAPGYSPRTVAVTLPAIQDATVDFTLDRAPVSGLTIRSVSTFPSAYEPFQAVEVEAEVQNTTSEPVAALYRAVIRNAQGTVMADIPAIHIIPGQTAADTLITVGANAQREIEIEWPIGPALPGIYSATIQAFSASGELLSEGSTSFTVNARREISGAVASNPPIVLAAAQPVQLSAKVSNNGNLDIEAGSARLTITLDTPDPNVRTAPEAAFFPVTSKGAMGDPQQVARDTDGRLYVTDANAVTNDGPAYYTIHRISSPDADPTVEARWARIPPTASDGSGTFSTILGAITATGGNIYGAVAGRGSVAHLTATSGLVDFKPTPASSQAGIDAAQNGELFVIGRKTNDTLLAIYRILPATWTVQEITVTGLGSFGIPAGIRVAGNGDLYVASRSGVIARIQVNYQALPLQGVAETLVTGAGTINGLAITGGTIYVTTSDGRITGYPSSGNPIALFNVREQFANATASARGIVADGADMLYIVEPSPIARVDRIRIVPPPPIPAAGTVVADFLVALPALPVTALEAATLGFPTWTPAYAGNYRLSLRSTNPEVRGEAINYLRVGGAAAGEVTSTPVSLVAPGNPSVDVSIRVTGAELATIAKLDVASMSQPYYTNSPVANVGSDRQGNVYYLRVPTIDFSNSAFGTVIRKVTPAGVDTLFFNSAAASPAFEIFMHGEIPVDDDGNVYVVRRSDQKIVKISPQGTVVGAPALELPATQFPTDKIASIVINANKTLFALTEYIIDANAIPTPIKGSQVLKFDFATQLWSRIASSPIATPFSISVDARDNLYVQYGFTQGTTQQVIRYRPDGSAKPILTDAIMEFEGPTVAGSCSNHAFVAAINWPLIGQTHEEFKIAQVNADTGKVEEIFDGKVVQAYLTDIDTIVYDRFSNSLLLWVHNGVTNGPSTNRILRVPMTCGGVDVKVRVVMPAGQDATGIEPPPSARRTLADGAIELEWALESATSVPQFVTLTTMLPGMALSDSRKVVRSAELLLTNSFSGSQVAIPLDVPAVTTDTQTTLSLATDRLRYGANETVTGTIGIVTSSSVPRTARLTIDVLDASQAIVASLPSVDVALPSQPSYATTFPTGTTLAGTYRMRASLVESVTGALLARNESAFDIVPPDNAISGSVTTDRTTYDPFTTAFITARAGNLSLNSIASGLTVAVRIARPDGSTVCEFVPAKTVSQLLPGSYRDFTLACPLGAAPDGSYTVFQTLTGSGLSIANQATFSVTSTATTGTGLVGSITGPRRVNRGTSAPLVVTVENQGNASASLRPVRLEVIDPASGLAVGETLVFDSTLDLGQKVERDLTWHTATVPAGTYTAVLSAKVGSNSINLAQASVVVADVAPFAFTPQAGVERDLDVLSNIVTIGGLAAAADISIIGGEYRINAGAWTSAPGTVSNGDLLQVRVRSGAEYATPTTATVLVGAFSTTFTVTTLVAPADTTPDAFQFTPQARVAPNTERTSNAITVIGTNEPAPISISGGTYSIGTDSFTSAPGMVAPGATVRVRLMSPNALLSTSSAQLTIDGVSGTFSATTLDLSGSVSANPSSPPPGQSVALTGMVLNLGDEPLPPIIITLAVARTAGLTVHTQTFNVPLAAQQSAAVGGSWVAQGAPGDNFTLTLGAEVGTTQRVLSATGIVLGANPVDVDMTAATLRPQRLLVLVACVDGGNGTGCLDTRKAQVQAMLGSRSIPYKIVTDDVAFHKELRSGAWTTYWISGGREKLGSTILEELQAAVHRGDTLLVDGMHDNRNNGLDDFLGFKHRGQRGNDTPTVQFIGPIYAAGTLTGAGRGRHVDLQDGVEQARFPATGPGNGSNSASPAVVSRIYGAGRTLFVALDLARTVTELPAWGPIFDKSLEYVRPTIVVPVAAGSMVQLAVTLDNDGAAANLALTATLPAGSAFASASDGGLYTDATRVIDWTLTLPVNATTQRSTVFRAPQDSGSYTVDVRLYTVSGGQRTSYATQLVTLVVKTAPELIASAMNGLNALTLTANKEKNARTAALARLQEANTAFGTGNFALAITKLMDAAAEVEEIGSVSVSAILGQIDQAQQHASYRWFLTQTQ